ncbi:hypothetical protein AJ79_07791 [Helicocarpus griseus UAMH5409]|uniref:HNH nuclease domain-containing protein n=1 Tax=Helicocarpus griseus UAMH5409 TaxID=1447875 RepID=A0A2B7WYV0_9EURO|nr:hypothetical protein AJ79_07791 [Helicocarpus griseus UAMH5409]
MRGHQRPFDGATSSFSTRVMRASEYLLAVESEIPANCLETRSANNGCHFGPAEKTELFDPRNGLILSSIVESEFDKGFFVIVPELPEDPTAADITQWQKADVKEYKFKLLDPTCPKASEVVPEIQEPWSSLDGKRLEFRNSFRPRSRYLYFNYCMQITRFTWRQKFQGQHLRERELGKKFWGTPGKYVRRNMLCAFVEEIGHRYDDLLQGAIEEDAALPQGENDDLMVLTAAGQVSIGSDNKTIEERHGIEYASESSGEEDADTDYEENPSEAN